MKVFYTPKMVADSAGYSPSAEKPALVMASWERFGVEIVEPEPVRIDQLCLAHDRDYVLNILACKELNGFGNRREDVALSLPYTNGAMLDAAICAFDEGIACAPVSGFHHARWDRWGGFCTFNGLMVTAISMLSEIPKVGILDCDQHYGDGTNDIIQKLKLWHRVRHFTYGRKSWEPEFFLSQLKGIVGSFADCGILLYQAGADPHENDPLGGNMSTEQLRQRDQIVFETCKRKGIPLVWNLAGGYQRDKHGSIRPVLDIHDNTMAECLAVYG